MFGTDNGMDEEMYRNHFRWLETADEYFVYGYDMPEGYAIEKDGKMYYAFFAPNSAEWKGAVELRGLKPGSYHVVDYADGKDLGSVEASEGKAPRLTTRFKEHLLLEVSQ